MDRTNGGYQVEIVCVKREEIVMPSLQELSRDSFFEVCRLLDVLGVICHYSNYNCSGINGNN